MPRPKFFHSALHSASDTQLEPLLSRCVLSYPATEESEESEREYIYIRAHTHALAEGDVCTFVPGHYGVVMGGVSSGNALQPAGVAICDIPAEHYGWIQRSGHCPCVKADETVNTAGAMLIVHLERGVATAKGGGDETEDAIRRFGWAENAADDGACAAILTLP